MKAVRISGTSGIDSLERVDLPDPGRPGPGEIRVRIRASSLNYHDYGVVRSGAPKFDGRIPLSDGAGEVEAIGEGVRDFVVGDAVVSTFFPGWLDGSARVADFATVPGDGIDGYAREIVVGLATDFTHAPRDYSHVEAACLTTAGLTAWRALIDDGGLKAGDRVLVLGTGGVSIFALQIAKAMGAHVIATSSSDAKLERLSALGADQVINYRTIPDWGREVQDRTDGNGVDHVVEVGGPQTLQQSILAARIGGHISLIGVLTGFGGEINTAELMRKQIRLQGLIVGSRRQQQEFVRAIDTIGLRPVTDRTFALDQLADAFRHQEAGAHFGKIGIEI